MRTRTTWKCRAIFGAVVRATLVGGGGRGGWRSANGKVLLYSASEYIRGLDLFIIYVLEAYIAAYRISANKSHGFRVSISNLYLYRESVESASGAAQKPHYINRTHLFIMET